MMPADCSACRIWLETNVFLLSAGEATEGGATVSRGAVRSPGEEVQRPGAGL